MTGLFSKEAGSVPRALWLKVSSDFTVFSLSEELRHRSQTSKTKKSIKSKGRQTKIVLRISLTFVKLCSKSRQCSFFPFGVLADLCYPLLWLLKENKHQTSQAGVDSSHTPNIQFDKVHSSLGSKVQVFSSFLPSFNWKSLPLLTSVILMIQITLSISWGRPLICTILHRNPCPCCPLSRLPDIPHISLTIKQAPSQSIVNRLKIFQAVAELPVSWLMTRLSWRLRCFSSQQLSRFCFAALAGSEQHFLRVQKGLYVRAAESLFAIFFQGFPFKMYWLRRLNRNNNFGKSKSRHSTLFYFWPG